MITSGTTKSYVSRGHQPVPSCIEPAIFMAVQHGTSNLAIAVHGSMCDLQAVKSVMDVIGSWRACRGSLSSW
jgi:hypothetical protein